MPGLNTKGSATCHPFSYPRLAQKTQGYEYRHSLNNRSGNSLLFSLGSTACGQWAI